MTTAITLIRAANPSPMTLSGTNTYLISGGNGDAICIDPGPPMPEHIDAILKASEECGNRIAWICITHAHPDHAPGARMLADRTGAPVAAHRDSPFSHNRALVDGDVIAAGDARLRVMEAPGHTPDHVVYYDERHRALFTGDVVLGEGYVVIAPPGGDMRSYQRTLERLAADFPDAQTIYGGHGEPCAQPAEKLADYIEHRRAREAQLLNQLREGPKTIAQLVAAIYAHTSRVLWPAAARQLLAYLIALQDEGRVRSIALERPLSQEERELLNPRWENIVGAQHAHLAQEELGSSLRLERIRVYESLT